jgi:iron complex outermembrane receptor protein
MKGGAVQDSRVDHVEWSNNRDSKVRFLSHAAALWLALLAAPALAQTTIEEVVVTAQKRAQSEQSVGITMSALTDKDLTSLNLQDTPEVALSIPNVQVNYGFGQNAFNVRGVGINFFSANLDSPVAVHLDEVYLSKNFMTTLTLFDVDRVEVLKGPQGTLFGRNTTGGSVNFFSKRPTEQFEAGATVGDGNYGAAHAEAYISGPLAPQLRGRLSGFIDDQRRGYYYNVTQGVDEGMAKKGAVRGELEWVADGTTVLGSLHYGKDKSNMTPYQGVGIFTPASLEAGAAVLCPEYLNGTVTGATADCVRGTDGRNNGDTNPYHSYGIISHLADNTAAGGMVRVEHSLQHNALTAITAVESFERAQQEDSDGSPLNTIHVYWYEKINQFTQELRLASTGDTRWNYIVGGFYEHDKFTNGDYLSVAAGAAPGYYSPFTQTVDAAAAFVHNNVSLTDAVSLVAGVRYTWERTVIDGGTYAATGLQSDGTRTSPTTILVPIATSGALANGGRNTDQNLSWKLGLEWKPSVAGTPFDEVLTYADISTGFRSGGFNADFAAIQAAFTTLSPERITAYEAGFKSAFAHRSVQLNAAIFHYDFRDGFVNVDNASSPIPTTINAASIKTTGAEFDTHWRPAAGLDLKVSVGWLDSAIKSNITSGGASLYGNSPVNAPKWTTSGQVSYDFPLAAGRTLGFSTDASWRDKQYLYIPNDPANLEPGYWLLNATVALHGKDDRWTVSAWGKNLNQAVYRTYVNDLKAFGWLLNIYGAPRTYGLTASVKF